MLSVLLLSMVALAQFAAAACDGQPEPVGLDYRRFVDDYRQRPLETQIWYPAVRTASSHQMNYSRLYEGCAARDAAYRDDGGRRALVLFSHGLNGTRFDQSWLAEYLAARGYIVAAVDHWNNTGVQNTPQEAITVWHRPEDISFVLSSLLDDAVWKTRVDSSRIGVAGHSIGGYTALALLGAQYNWLKMRAFCVGPPPAPDCNIVPEVDLSKIDFSGSNRLFTDARIQAAFVMSPAIGPGIDQESLTRIRRPVEVVYTDDDEVVNPRLSAIYYASAVPGSRLMKIKTGGHFAFLPRCSPGSSVITDNIPLDLCGKKVMADRDALHRRIGEEALQFFNGTLEFRPARDTIAAKP